uniref:Uncharacterized protein n=1 Tax=Clastoptera arizonana TaxID=38151 RepID=A0A1B6DLC5_9HEMI
MILFTFCFFLSVQLLAGFDEVPDTSSDSQSFVEWFWDSTLQNGPKELPLIREKAVYSLRHKKELFYMYYTGYITSFGKVSMANTVETKNLGKREVSKFLVIFERVEGYLESFNYTMATKDPRSGKMSFWIDDFNIAMVVEFPTLEFCLPQVVNVIDMGHGPLKGNVDYTTEYVEYGHELDFLANKTLNTILAREIRDRVDLLIKQIQVPSE